MKTLEIFTYAKIKNINTEKIFNKRYFYKFLVNMDIVKKAIENKIFKENPFILPFYLGNIVLLDTNERLTEQELKNIVFKNVECTKVVLDGKIIY